MEKYINFNYHDKPSVLIIMSCKYLMPFKRFLNHLKYGNTESSQIGLDVLKHIYNVWM